MMNRPPGAELALDDDEIRDFLTLADTIDWTQPREANRQYLEHRYDWQPRPNRRMMTLPNGLSGSVQGTDNTSIAVVVRHSYWELDFPEVDLRQLEYVEQVRNVVEGVAGSPAMADTHRWVERNPEKYASYGEEGEHA